jgi:hypothetical protein
MVRELARWLEPADATDAAQGDAFERWSGADWVAFRRAVGLHGLAPHLERLLRQRDLFDRVPADVGSWLTGQRDANRVRIHRMHDELAAILRRAAAAGIEVMPLKGSLLTTLESVEPGERPMADLDLLVRPDARAAIGAVLEELGYRAEATVGRRPGPDTFVDPGGGVVVSFDGEHPDNPRRVEVHLDVKRHLWPWDDADRLTGALWAGASHGVVLGEPAVLPRLDATFAHLAVHATSDLLLGRGRLMHWLDFAVLAARTPGPADWLHPRLAFPSLALAARTLPVAMGGLDLGALARLMPSRLVGWARGVPFDGRAGLVTAPHRGVDADLANRWERWRPDRWRLAVAYGDVSTGTALLRHARTLARRLRST